MFENLGSALLSKGILIKGAAAAVGGATIGVTWWQVYDNIYPKTVQEEMGQDSVFSSKSHTSLDDIPDLQLTFSDNNGKFKDEFKESDCIKKYLPGKISDVPIKDIENSKESDSLNMIADGFGGTSRGWKGFVGTEGCLSINIKYKNDSNNGGIIGKIELVAWNNPNGKDKGYAMIMSSIISNLQGKFNFVNKLTFLQKPTVNQDWQFNHDQYQSSAIWLDTASPNDFDDKEIKFTFGKEVFTYKATNKNTTVQRINENTDNVEYKKLARWIPGEKGKGNNDALLGHWNININNKKTDLWKSLEEIKESKSSIKSKLSYKQSDKKWYENRKFTWDFNNFDRWNPGHNNQNNGNNHLSIYGTWVDVWKECIKNKNENVCLNKN